MSLGRAQLDAAFPTVVRYAGVVLMLALFGAMVTGLAEPASVVAFLIPAAGMIGFKTVVGKGNGE